MFYFRFPFLCLFTFQVLIISFVGPELSRQACPPLCLFSYVFQRYGFTSMFFPFLLLNTCYLLFLLLSLSLSLSLSHCYYYNIV